MFLEVTVLFSQVYNSLKGEWNFRIKGDFWKCECDNYYYYISLYANDITIYMVVGARSDYLDIL